MKGNIPNDVAGLEAEDFFRDAHRIVFRSMRSMDADNTTIDLVTLKASLGSKLDDVGGAAYLASLTDGVPRSTNVAAYADIIWSHAAARRMLAVLTRAHARLHADPAAASKGAAADLIVELQTVTGKSEARTLELVDDLDMIARPEPEPLVSGVLLANSLAGVFGPSGVGKTFMALRLGVSVCTGQSFFGATVPEPGNVVHVLGEGAGRFGARLAAVKLDLGIEADSPLGYYTLPQPIDFLDPRAVGHLIDASTAVAPRLVIIDTVNRNMGGNESATEDMTAFVAACDRLRISLGCAALVLHHCGWDDSRERGSTVLRAAVDGWMSLRRKDDGLLLSCEKARDLDPFKEIRLSLMPAHGSAVLQLDEVDGGRELTDVDRNVLDALPPDGATRAAWAKAASAVGTNRTSAYRAIDRLERAGCVEVDGKTFKRPGEGS